MKRITAAALVAGLAALSLAPPAFAALPPNCTAADDKTNPVISKVQATDAVVYPTGTSHVTVTVTAADPDGPMTCRDATLTEFATSGSSGVAKVGVVIAGTDDDGPNYDFDTELDAVSPGVWQTTFDVDRRFATGVWSVSATVDDVAGNKVEAADAAAFLVRANGGLSVNAAPEPVRKGAYLTVSGKVRLLPTGSSSSGGYVAAKDIPIRIYFSAKGSGTWTYMGAARSGANGVYTRKFKASRDGGWQARIPENEYFVTKRSSVDTIDVR